MELVKIKDMYDFISFFPILLYIYGFLELVINNNSYLFIGLVICSITHRLIKQITKTWNPNIFKRPDNASDTNGLNSGGFFGKNPGFPSGHTIGTTYVMFYLIFTSNKGIFEIDNLLKIIIVLLVAYARVMKGAHRVIQVIAGFLLGIIIAYIFAYKTFELQ